MEETLGAGFECGQGQPAAGLDVDLAVAADRRILMANSWS